MKMKTHQKNPVVLAVIILNLNNQIFYSCYIVLYNMAFRRQEEWKIILFGCTTISNKLYWRKFCGWLTGIVWFVNFLLEFIIIVYIFLSTFLMFFLILILVLASIGKRCIKCSFHFAIHYNRWSKVNC